LKQAVTWRYLSLALSLQYDKCPFRLVYLMDQLHVLYILICIQQDVTLHSLSYLETALHVSGVTTTHHQERKKTLPTASGICHTVIATCRYNAIAACSGAIVSQSSGS